LTHKTSHGKLKENLGVPVILPGQCPRGYFSPVFTFCLFSSVKELS
jgi:hypothetical protein